jgi:hypothetical protein
MMQPTDLRDRHDGAITGRHDWTRNRRVFIQRQVRAGSFVVRTIERHQLPQARFGEHDHVIETLATSGSNKSLDEWIFQGARGAVSTSSIPIACAVARRPSKV